MAPRLLGAVLRHGEVAVRITEVEAYDGPNDPGSHAFRGPTPRNAVMFGPPGHLYCYFTYGMHVCCNVVCGPEGTPSAVLLRAGEVVEGVELARARRPGARDRDLARGPARLCRALAHRRSTTDGADLAAGPVTLTRGDAGRRDVSTGPRVGLRGAPDRPWRFWIDGGADACRRTVRRRRGVSGAAADPIWLRAGAAANVLLVAASGSHPGREANWIGVVARPAPVEPISPEVDGPSGTGKFLQVAPAPARKGPDGVRLILENSTVCHSRRISL